MKWFLQVRESYLDIQEVEYEQPIVWRVEKRGEGEKARGEMVQGTVC